MRWRAGPLLVGAALVVAVSCGDTLDRQESRDTASPTSVVPDPESRDTTSPAPAVPDPTTTMADPTTPAPAASAAFTVQDGNDLPVTRLVPRSSTELDDNRIGIHISGLWRLEPEAFPGGELTIDHILSQGVSRVRFAINNLDVGSVQWDRPEIPIDPRHDQFITDLADHGITLTYVLTFWDKEWVAAGGELPNQRLKTEPGIQRYLDYVRYTVGALKDRVEYFEIWNEPNTSISGQSIDVADYINLVSRTASVIREQYPEAKIVVGGVGDIRVETEFEYFSEIIESDAIMPLVDVVSWHGMYDVSPEYDYFRDYYYGYPSLVAQIRATAASHGFTGEFVSDELSWRTWDSPCHCRHEGVEALSSELVAAKNYARGILMNLGLDLSVSHFYVVPRLDDPPQLIPQAIRNVSTIMSGARSKAFDVDVTSTSPSIVTYTFGLPNGDLALALWNDDTAQDVDSGSVATVTVPGLGAEAATAVDALYGFQQRLVIHDDGGNLVISDLVVRDSPMVILLSGVIAD